MKTTEMIQEKMHETMIMIMMYEDNKTIQPDRVDEFEIEIKRLQDKFLKLSKKIKK